MADQPFFIGWEDQPAPAPVRRSRSWAMLWSVIGLVLVGAFAGLQQGFQSPARWNFTERTFEGIFLAEPYPTLIAEGQVHYLVLYNKEAVAAADAAPLHLNAVKLTGSVIEDPDQPVAMIAVKNAAMITATGGSPADPFQSASPPRLVSLRGEIVDSKCAFGAMNPAVFKPHRACAIACLAGGIPPVLVVRHAGGTQATHYLLLNEAGGPMKETALKFAALPVEVSGTVTSVGEWHLLRADAASIRTLN